MSLKRQAAGGVFWNLLNTFILGAFVITAFRESRHNRREEKGLPPKGSAKVAAEAAAARALAQDKIGSGLSERTYEGLPPVRIGTAAGAR